MGVEVSFYITGTIYRKEPQVVALCSCCCYPGFVHPADPIAPARDDIVFQQFQTYRILDSITNPLAREYGVKVILFSHGNEKLNGLIQAGIKEMKDEFRR